MATIHPSRMGLVPASRQPPPRPPPSESSREDELKKKLLERRSRDDPEGERRERDGGRERWASERSRDGNVKGSRAGPRDDRHGDRERPRDGHDRSGRAREEDIKLRERRASPSYQPYSQHDNGPPRGGMAGANYGYGSRDDLPHLPRGPPGPPGFDGRGPPGMPPRGGWQNPPPRFNGPVNFEARRQERNNSTLSIWPSSPKAPYMDDDELEAERKKRKSKSKSSKSRSSKSKSKRKHARYSDSSSTDSEEEDRRRRRRRREKERERESGDDKKKRYDSEEDRERRKKRRGRSEEVEDEDMWVERTETKDKGKEVLPVSVPALAIEEDDVDEVGPQLPKEFQDKIDKSAYHNMLRGEGEAMAAYAESGQRIPRRGEIGLDSDTIATFEQSGYVMSGSRHQRMNAVRMRKENQVINEAEKRAMLKMQREERQKKEGAIVSQFKEMIDENLRKQGLSGQ